MMSAREADTKAARDDLRRYASKNSPVPDAAKRRELDIERLGNEGSTAERERSLRRA